MYGCIQSIYTILANPVHMHCPLLAPILAVHANASCKEKYHAAYCWHGIKISWQLVSMRLAFRHVGHVSTSDWCQRQCHPTCW